MERQKVRLVSEDAGHVLLSWPCMDSAERYVVEGITDMFNFMPAAETDRLSKVIKKDPRFIGYRVRAVAKGDDRHRMPVAETDVLLLRRLKEIRCSRYECVDGTSAVVMASDECYYRYRITDEDGNMLVETEDCVVVGEFPKKIIAEGYNKSNLGYVLDAVSDGTCAEVAHPKGPAGAPLLSVVVPVWNSPEYLPRTVMSILGSSLDGIEVVLVDDGSDEETARLVDRFAELSGKVTAKHLTEHRGPCAARNAGMDVARGKWAAYCDSDDVVHPYMYEKLVRNAEEQDVDVAIASTLTHRDVGERYNSLKNVTGPSVQRVASFRDMMDRRVTAGNLYFMSPCNKVVRTGLARRVRFDEDNPKYEDMAYTLALYSHARGYAYVRNAYYVWDKRKRLTVGTYSGSGYTERTEYLWAAYMRAMLYALNTGNQDEIEQLKAYVMEEIIRNLCDHDMTEPSKRIVAAVARHIEKTYGRMPMARAARLPIEGASPLQAWVALKRIDVGPWDCTGDVPAEIWT